MLRHFPGAAILADAFDIISRVSGFASEALRPPPRPEPFEEFDPRKTAAHRDVNGTPTHSLGAGGRAEMFRLPRD